MQRALWPATLGYWMDKMMTPVFGDDVVEAPAGFFTRYVERPRPAARAADRRASPTACSPTTAFSRIGWIRRRSADGARARAFLPGCTRWPSRRARTGRP